MKRRLVLTQSEAKTWLDCEVRAHLAYEEHLSPAGRPSKARAGGTSAHRALLGGYRAWASLGPVAGPTEARRAFSEGMARAFDALREEVGAISIFEDDGGHERLADLDRLWEGLRLYESEIVSRDVETSFPIGVEQGFEVPLLTSRGEDRYLVSTRGAIDLLLCDRTDGGLVVRDHKFITTGQADTYDVRFALDVQTRVYLYAVSLLFGRSARVAQFGVATQFGPSEPKVNKDGTVSTAKIATTRSIYEAACAKQEPTWMGKPDCDVRLAQLRDVQRHVAESLPDNLARWVSLHEHVYSEQDIDDARETLYQVARRVRLHRRGELSPVRNARSCSILRCDYQSPCSLGRTLGEIVYLARSNDDFEVREDRHAEVEGTLWTMEHRPSLPW